MVKIAGQKIDVEFRADAKQFHNEIKNVKKELKELRRDWARDDRATKSYSGVGERLQKSFSSTSEQYKKQQRLVNRLNKEMTTLTEKHNSLKQEALKLRNAQGKNSEEYQKALKAAKRYGKGVKGLKPILQEQQKELEYLEKKLHGIELAYNTHFNSFSKLGRGLGAVGKKFNEWGENLSNFGMSLMPMSLGITALGKSSYEAFKNYEMGIVGVQKTTKDLQGKSLEQFKQSIREIAETKPLPIADLLKVSELGGQLNIGKEHLAEFSEVINELAITTDLNVEEASLKLAQLMNIMGTDNGDVRKLGNVINELGNNTATTEQTIVDFSHRLMAAGRQVGLTEADVLALSATLGATGAQVEAGGSNMSKTLLEMSFAINGADEKATAYKQKLQELGLTTDDVKKASKEGGDTLENMAKQFGMAGFELEAYNKLVTDGATSIEWFAKASGKSAEEFAQIWKKNPMEALELFVKGLHDMEERGESAAAYLEQMGIKNLRQRDVLLKLASGYDVLADATGRANKEWKNGNALAEEAQKFYETQEGKIQRIKNQIEFTKISIGEKLAPIILQFMEHVEKVITGFNDLSEGTQDFIIKAGLTLAVLAPLSLGLGSVSKAIGDLFSGLGSIVGEKGFGGFIGKILTGTGEIKKLGTATAGLKGAGDVGVGGLTKLLTTAGTSAGGLALEIGAVGLALYGLGQKVKEVRKELKERKEWNSNPESLTGDVIKGQDGKFKRVKNKLFGGDPNSSAGLYKRKMQEDSGEIFQFSETTKELMTKAEERNQNINNILSKGYSMQHGLHKQAHNQLKELITEQDVALKETREENQKKVLNGIAVAGDEWTTEQLQQYQNLSEKVKAHYEKQTEEQKALHKRRGEILEELTNAQGQRRLDLLAEWSEKEKEWRKLELDEYAQNEDERIVLEQRVQDFRIEQGKKVFDKLIEQAQQTRDETIRLAEEQYDNVVLQANKMLEAGDITQQEYDKMIQLAKEAREKTVQEANEQMQGILATLSQQLPGITLLWDEATGKIKIKYEETGKEVDATSKEIAKALEYAGNESTRFSNNFQSAMSTAVQDAKNLINQLNGINNIKLHDKSMRIHTISSFRGASPTGFLGATRSTGSFMAGIKNVPYNDMWARLHEGERVLTKDENRIYNMLSSADMLKNLTKLTKGQANRLSGNINNTNQYSIDVHLDNVHIKDDRDVRQLTKDIANQLRKEVSFGR